MVVPKTVPDNAKVSFKSGTLYVEGLTLTPEQCELAIFVAQQIAEEACQQFEYHDGSTYANEVRRYFGLIP